VYLKRKTSVIDVTLFAEELFVTKFKQFAAIWVALVAGLPLMGSTLTYVGSYQVDQGAYWGTNPLSYTAQEGAAIVFGGIAGDYQISTNSNTVDPSTVTGTGWYSTWGIANGQQYAQNFKLQTGTGYNDPGGSNSAISAYVQDNALGAKYTKYGWSVAATETPEPATFGVLGIGLVGLVSLRRRIFVAR
jgi:hypothetical protein